MTFNREFDAAVFGIQPKDRGAEATCQQLLADRRLTEGVRLRSKRARNYWRGYRSLLFALMGDAQAYKKRYKVARELLTSAIETSEGARFTRSWTEQDLRRCYQVDLAIVLHLSGRSTEAHRLLNDNDHPVAKFIQARILIETGKVKQGVELLRLLDSVGLGDYSHRFVNKAEIELTLRSYETLSRKPGLYISSDDLGWWMN